MNENLIINDEIVGQVEYYIVANTIFIQEIAIFGNHKRKGYGTKTIYDLFNKHKYVPVGQIVGISTEDSKPFWEKLNAVFSEEMPSGDCAFSIGLKDIMII